MQIRSSRCPGSQIVWTRQASNLRWTFFYSGKEAETHTSGVRVGLLFSPAAGRALESYESISDRLLIARLNCGTIRMKVVVCY